MLFYMIAGSTVFVFRWRNPDAVRLSSLGIPGGSLAVCLAATVLLYYTFGNLLYRHLGAWPSLPGVRFSTLFSSRRRITPES